MGEIIGTVGFIGALGLCLYFIYFSAKIVLKKGYVEEHPDPDYEKWLRKEFGEREKSYEYVRTTASVNRHS